jgi:hypothetical protein
MSELIGLLIFAGLIGFLCAIALRGTVNAIAPEPDDEPGRTPEERYRRTQE